MVTATILSSAGKTDDNGVLRTSTDNIYVVVQLDQNSMVNLLVTILF